MDESFVMVKKKMASNFVVKRVPNDQIHSLERVLRLATHSSLFHLNEGERGDENESHDYQRSETDRQAEREDRGSGVT